MSVQITYDLLLGPENLIRLRDGIPETAESMGLNPEEYALLAGAIDDLFRRQEDMAEVTSDTAAAAESPWSSLPSRVAFAMMEQYGIRNDDTLHIRADVHPPNADIVFSIGNASARVPITRDELPALQHDLQGLREICQNPNHDEILPALQAAKDIGIVTTKVGACMAGIAIAAETGGLEAFLAFDMCVEAGRSFSNLMDGIDAQNEQAKQQAERELCKDHDTGMGGAPGNGGGIGASTKFGETLKDFS
ncbi:hypothetical protein ATY78_15165 [Rhizobium sp. R635]|nr:hypothetical protein ATY78_15165 [Rhizobium sp. R635]